MTELEPGKYYVRSGYDFRVLKLWPNTEFDVQRLSERFPQHIYFYVPTEEENAMDEETHGLFDPLKRELRVGDKVNIYGQEFKLFQANLFDGSSVSSVIFKPTGRNVP